MKKHTWSNLIWQPLLAVIFISIVLFFMDHYSTSDVLWAVGAGSLSSSSYIVFGSPSLKSALPEKIIGGYVIGILTGFLLRFAIMYSHHHECGLFGMPNFYMIAFLAAISVGLCLFFMALLRVQHPPAAGMALILVIDMRDYIEILIVLLASLLLAIVRYALRNRLVDLT